MNFFIIKILLAYFSDWIKKRILCNKIEKIKKSRQKSYNLSKKSVAEYKKYWQKFEMVPDVRWFKVYASINGIIDPKYVSEIDYYTKIEPVLNNRAFSEAYCDKNFYHHLIDNGLLPAVYLRNIENVFYDQSYMTLDIDEPTEVLPQDIDRVIVKKAVDSGGGKGIELFFKVNGLWRNKEGDELNSSYLEKVFGKNYIIQEYVVQHKFYEQFNKSSVNTIRLLTYRSVRTNKPVILQAVFRIGRPGSVVDNQASGGIACGINPDGVLKNFAVNKEGKIFHEFNGIEFSRVGKLFRFDEIAKIGLDLARKFYYHRLLGFDFCVGNDGIIKLIEVNNRNNEINFYQMTNGPLFREFTEEVVNYCQKHKRTYCFDFEI